MDEEPPDVDPTDAEHREIGKNVLTGDMGPSSALAHLYRGEIHRMKFWRQRLDQTTHWAIVVMSAVLTWGFTGRDRPHFIMLGGAVALTAFLFIEARRYRGYDIWRGRVRKLQRNVFAYGLDPSVSPPDPEWRRELGRDYREPAIKISTEEAIAHRLRRVYLSLFTIILGAWVIRVTTFDAQPWPESAAVGDVPGVLVTGVVAISYLLAVVVAVRPREWQCEDELHHEAVGRRH